jgi:hypothetical protein
MCFPSITNAVLGSVPPSEAGVASGTNSAVRELGGVFGVAVLAAVFIRQGVYASPDLFVDGFRAALLTGAGITALGLLAALFAPGRAKPQDLSVPEQPALVLVSERGGDL